MQGENEKIAIFYIKYVTESPYDSLHFVSCYSIFVPVVYKEGKTRCIPIQMGEKHDILYFISRGIPDVFHLLRTSQIIISR